MDFFDVYQQGQLKKHARGLRQTAEDISDQRRQTDMQLSNADQRVDRLALIFEAMPDRKSASFVEQTRLNAECSTPSSER